MELRFLKGKWGFGSYKLQFTKGFNTGWFDVPTVDPDSCNHSGTCQESEEYSCKGLSHFFNGEKIEHYSKDCPNKDMNDVAKIKVSEEKMEPRWCKHFCSNGNNQWLILEHGGYQVFDYIGWKFCPICGTPRPVELPLRERLAEVLCKTMENNKYKALNNMAMFVADAAIKFLGENK